MIIDRVSITYGELRSTGFPDFSNRRFDVSLSAQVEPGETANEVKERLYQLAKSEVKAKFGDKDAFQSQMDIPFSK